MNSTACLENGWAGVRGDGRVQGPAGFGLRSFFRGLPALVALGCADAAGPDDPACHVVTRRSAADVTLSLSPGEMCALPVDDVVSMEVLPGGASARYLIAVQSGLRAPDAITRLRLSARGRGAAPARLPALAAVPEPIREEARELEAVSRAELILRNSARRALLGARPLTAPRARPGLPPARAVEDGSERLWDRAARARSGSSPRPPMAGDTVLFHNAVHPDLGVDCAGIHDVTAVVRAVGRHFAVAEDVEGAGAVSPEEYAGLARSLDRIVYPVVTTYFGEPADLDGNGVVWALFTPVVNRMTSRRGTTRILGFFNPADLAHPGSCAASNAGELLWLLAADPDGRYSKPVPQSFPTTRAVGVAAHELEHLISAERRVVLEGGSFADLEQTWLSEGLAHSAETFVGMSLAGLRPGGNYGFDELTSDVEVFEAYHFANFRRAAYYLGDPHRAPVLGDAYGRDPSGVSSLAMRGFGWLLLRWFADQYAAGGGGLLGGPPEEAIFRDLAGGGPQRTRGIENLERVASRLGAPGDWEALLATWALSPLADGLGDPAPPSTRVTSLDLRDVYEGLHRVLEGDKPFEDEFPLVATGIGLAADTDVRIDFDLNAATARYFVLESDGAHPALGLRLRKLAGGRRSGSAGVRVVILRAR